MQEVNKKQSINKQALAYGDGLNYFIYVICTISFKDELR